MPRAIKRALTAKSPARKEASFHRLEVSLPRDKLIQVLQPSGDPRVQQLIECLLSTNPNMLNRSLPSLAAMCKLGYADLIREIARSRVSEGILRMSKHIPQVLEDAAIDAKSRSSVCPECKGTTQVLEDRPAYLPKATPSQPNPEPKFIDCPTCAGKGKVRKSGNHNARKLMFEAVGLTNRKAPPLTVNFPGAKFDVPTMESEMTALDRVLDATPVKASR